MSSTKIPSPARSQGVISTPRQRRFRVSRSVGSPSRSTTSVKLSNIVRENKKDSFMFSPLPSRRSVLSDNTEIEMPKRRSWWKRLDDNSKDVMEFIEKREQQQAVNIEELIDAEILSQEKKNYTIDLPESSDGESIRSIVLPQRKLFTQKDQSQKVYKDIMDKRENLERLQKSKINYDNTIRVGKKDLFNKGNRERSKPVFPAALLNISLDKTELNKKDKDISKQGQVRNLFGNRLGIKRKNMFAEFIVSDSEDEISDIQPKVFAFAKNSEPSHRIRETSPTSDITDVELDEWKLLPSSTMVDNQFGNFESNTPVKKARLSKTALDKTIKSTSKNVENRNRSFNKSKKTLKNKPMEDVSPNQTRTENNVKYSNSKTRINEIVNVIDSCVKVHDSKRSKTGDNLSDGTKISQSTSNNIKENLQKNGEYVTSEGNQEQIGDIEMSQNISKYNDENLQEDEENQAGEENREDSDDIEMSQNISENNDEDLQKDDNNDEDLKEDEENDEDLQEDEENEADEGIEGESDIEMAQNISENNDEDLQKDENNDEDLQEDEENDEDLQEDEENEADEGNEGESDIEMAQNISENNEENLLENREYESNEGIQEEFDHNKIRHNNSKNYEESLQVNEGHYIDQEIREEIGNVEQNEKAETEVANQEELDKMETSENLSKNNKNNLQKDKKYEDNQLNREKIIQDQSDERQKNMFVSTETKVEGSKSINVEENKDVDNQDQQDRARNVSKNSMNKSQRKDKNNSRGEETEDVIDNQNQHKSFEEEKNNQTQANSATDPNKSQRRDKQNKTRENIDNVPNRNSIVQNKSIPERSVQNRSRLNVTHDTTGRNRDLAELEIKSPEEVRNYIANGIESISPAGRETSSRKTRSVIKLNELRPSLAPLRESTGISDGTNNSSVERSGWDSHRTTRKTLRQTFGKDFTPRKSLRALVMEKSAKRQTYGFDVTTKIPQACSTRLPENMHDITNDENDEIIDQQQKSEIQIEVSEKVPVMESEEDGNKEKTFFNNSTRKDALEHRHSMGNETRLKLQENDVKRNKQTANLSNIVNGDENSDGKHELRSSKQNYDIEREESRNNQENEENIVERRTSQEMEGIASDKEDGEVEEMQHSQKVQVEYSDQEMQGSQEAEVEGSDEEIQDSQNVDVEASDEGIQSHGFQEDEESEDEKRDSRDIEERETDEERESSQEVEAGEESDQEMQYSEDDEVQEREGERIDSQDNEVESEEEREGSQNSKNEESDEGRRYSSQIVIEEESDEENVDSQNTRNVSKQRFFLNNSTREQSSNFTEESNREDSLTKKQNIIEIFQKLKQQNLEMSRQAEQAVRNSLKRPPRESSDVFKVPLRPNAGLRRMKPAAFKPKPKTVKFTHVGVENLPPEVLEDLKYKPPKRYRPSNASWITKRLYKYLETKLEPKYDYKARVRAEKLAETLYEFAKETRRRHVADSNSVDALKNEMARLGIVTTHFEFNQFFHDFMPREIRIKVVPDLVNNIAMPKHGIFSNIIK